MGPPEIFNIRSPEPDSSGKKIFLLVRQEKIIKILFFGTVCDILYLLKLL
jgi:hypothetical protein